MASRAYSTHLEHLLDDVREINRAHKGLRTGNRGRVWGLGGLNRAAVVVAVSAWEGYVEALVREAIEALKPTNSPLGTWPALKASAQSYLGRFNTPNTENVNLLFESVLGLPRISEGWQWRNCDARKAESYLTDVLKERHQIAHGVSPRPTIHNKQAEWLPVLFLHLGRCTDSSVSIGMQRLFAVTPWPVP